jgi:hypothetical protein
MSGEFGQVWFDDIWLLFQTKKKIVSLQVKHHQLPCAFASRTMSAYNRRLYPESGCR